MTRKLFLLLPILAFAVTVHAQSPAVPEQDTTNTFRIGPCMSTISSTQPLTLVTVKGKKQAYILDTLPAAELDSKEIMSLKVIKDASMQAIYGSRASAGVIRLTISRRAFQRLQSKGTFRQE